MSAQEAGASGTAYDCTVVITSGPSPEPEPEAPDTPDEDAPDPEQE